MVLYWIKAGFVWISTGFWLVFYWPPSWSSVCALSLKPFIKTFTFMLV